uniref:Uncharacterized protein n=1 Tax=Rhizophora mucronata TaxID=61149 RepID=A0A2P2Q505_RHIMU
MAEGSKLKTALERQLTCMPLTD